MRIINNQKKRSVRELEAIARELRALSIINIHAAGSGHPGGTLSIMDILTVLYFAVARFKPNDPLWQDRDRIYLSAGHKAPALYAVLAKAGFYPKEDTVTLRKIGSPFQGHPSATKLKGVEVSSGSLGQGLGIAVGSALAGKMGKGKHRVYCLMGDGEQQEGSIWEAAMAAGQYKLDNLCAVVDCNRLQIDGWVKEVMTVEPLAEKYSAFNWHVLTIDGHDIEQIQNAFFKAQTFTGKPTVIIAETVKGKGVSFMENEASWHGTTTKTSEQLYKALNDINCSNLSLEHVEKLLQDAKDYQRKQDLIISKILPKHKKDYWWNSSAIKKVEMVPTRFGFGKCLKDIGDDPRIITIHADISDSIKISDFEKDNPERRGRVINSGIAEQNMMSIAAGLALEGKIPITGTYGVFASGRPWDQIRTTICYDRLNVKIAGAHGGISVGPDGATHQALEEISLMNVLPNMSVFVPCDAVEAERITKIAILDIFGPAYIRFAREATPIVTTIEAPLVMGKANVIRYRKSAETFIDSFETELAQNYSDEGEDITLIACGPMVPEAMRAALILKEQYEIETRVMNVHTVKPIDSESLINAANETGAIITCEEHQKGGFGNIIAGEINRKKDYQIPLLFDMIGVEDRFGESGRPWELMISFNLCAEHIAEKSLKLLERKV